MPKEKGNIRDLKKGDAIVIYNDPISRQSPEGVATLIQHLGFIPTETEDTLGAEHWLIHFNVDEPDHFVQRIIYLDIKPAKPSCSPRITHTPGPWTIKDEHLQLDPEYVQWPITIIAKSDKLEETVLIADIPLDSHDEIANARLIASAPDLLSSLKDLMSLWDREDIADTWNEEFMTAQKTIDKAEGNE